jgi:hypothetical protein
MEVEKVLAVDWLWKLVMETFLFVLLLGKWVYYWIVIQESQLYRLIAKI